MTGKGALGHVALDGRRDAIAGTAKVTYTGCNCAIVISSVCVGGDEVAGLHRQVAGAAVDRRPDRRVAELHARVVDGRLLRDELRPRALDGRLVGLDRGGGGVGRGPRLLRLVLRDDAALGQLRLALRRQLRYSAFAASRLSCASACASSASSRVRLASACSSAASIGPRDRC